MTEYDYSPSAVERYLETQSRVSKWVSNQSTEITKYSSPFDPVPSETEDPSYHEFYTAEPVPATASKPSPSNSHSLTSDLARPTVRRSHTEYGGHESRSRRRHRDHSSSRDNYERDGSHRHRHDPNVSSSQRPYHHTRSHTAQVYYQPPMAAPIILSTPVRAQTMPAPIVVVPGGRPHPHYQSDMFKPRFITLPTRNQKYKVPASPSSETIASNSPTKKSLPLFKRLFRTLTSSHHGRSQSASNNQHPKESVRSWTLIDLVDNGSGTSHAPRDLEKKRSSGSSGAATLVNPNEGAEKDKSGTGKSHHRGSSSGKASAEDADREKTGRGHRSSNARTFVESGGKPRRKRGHTIN